MEEGDEWGKAESRAESQKSKAKDNGIILYAQHLWDVGSLVGPPGLGTRNSSEYSVREIEEMGIWTHYIRTCLFVRSFVRWFVRSFIRSYCSQTQPWTK